MTIGGAIESKSKYFTVSVFHPHLRGGSCSTTRYDAVAHVICMRIRKHMLCFECVDGRIANEMTAAVAWHMCAANRACCSQDMTVSGKF